MHIIRIIRGGIFQNPFSERQALLLRSYALIQNVRKRRIGVGSLGFLKVPYSWDTLASAKS